MKTTDPKKVCSEQAILDIAKPEKAADETDYPEMGAETLTGAETDSSDLETEPLDDEDNSL